MRLRKVFMVFFSTSLLILTSCSYGERLHADLLAHDNRAVFGPVHDQGEWPLLDLRESGNPLYVDSKKDGILLAIREPQIPREPRVPREPQIPREPKVPCFPEIKNIG